MKMLFFHILTLLFMLCMPAIGSQSCTDLQIPVCLTSRLATFNLQPAQGNIEVTDFILAGGRQGFNGTKTQLKSYYDKSAVYTIAATYCTPLIGLKKGLQILTHGIGFDRTYWDAPFNDHNYSYVNKAMEAGYATLAHDRLGIGASSRGDPINEIQATLEIEALRALTQAVRDGSVAGVPAYQAVYHVGHSFGSVQTFALSREYPNISNGIILQGWAPTGDYLSDFVFGGNFVDVQTTPLKDNYTAGYFAAGNPSAVQTNFFAPGQFDPKMLEFAVETGQPVSQGEMLTIGGAGHGVSSFKGPVLVITGERDLPFCGGDCLATNNGFGSIPGAAQEVFANVTVQVQIVRDAGHGLNYEYRAQDTFAKMIKFLDGVGLGGSVVTSGAPSRGWW
jgi:pimeloyl-ACP methyl ester carboxylesterase